MKGPNPESTYPLRDYKNLIFLKPFVKTPNIHIGEYTYFDDQKNGPENFENNNVLYNYDFLKVKLVIGKFCAIAAETRFIMTGDHKLDGFSTYPFPIFGCGWESTYNISDLPTKGDIIVGNDVWFGYACLIKGGVTIGDGAIIGTKAVVTKDVPAYSIVAGNPATVVKMRFNTSTIQRLLKVSWWNLSIEIINKHLTIISESNIDQLESILQS